MKSTFAKESFFSVSPQTLFQFHERQDAFSLLTPPSEGIEVLSTASTLAPSPDVVRFVTSFLFLKLKFEMIHTVYQPYDLFVDEQKSGLFTTWRHEHRFLPGGWEDDPAVMLQDRIEYGHPLGMFLRPFVNHRLGKLFAFRHQATSAELHKISRTRNQSRPSTVIITGATGLIGRRITQILLEKGIRVIAFVRNKEKAEKILGDEVTLVSWDFSQPEEGAWKKYLSEAQGVIHLAGTPLFKQRWNPAFKKQMLDSRVLGTRQLVEAIRAADPKPQSFITASAVGFYGTDPNRVAEENSSPGDDLLSRICIKWEEEAQKIEQAGLRSVQVRIGIVLSTESGALKELLPLFRTGLGGPMGYADHWINWIHLEDVARIFVMALENNAMSGPYNAAAPHPVTMEDFAKTVAKVLRRPCLMKYPPPLLKVIVGEAGRYVSGGSRALSAAIQKEGYGFFFEGLEPALRNVLGKP